MFKIWFRKQKEKKQDLIRRIYVAVGYYYFEKNNSNQNKAYQEIQNLDITEIVYSKNNIVITLTRPGLLIGVKGSNIEALTSYLKEKLSFNFNEIRIKEDIYHSYLYAFSSIY